MLKEHSGFLFLSLGARLMNDDNADCRSLVADTIECLLKLLERNDRDELFDIVTELLNDSLNGHREMAAQLCIRFINVEQQKFVGRITKVLPILVSRLSFIDPSKPGRYVKVMNVESDDEMMEESDEDEEEEGDDDDNNEKDVTDEIKENHNQRLKDHQLIQVQNAILKLFETCTDLFNDTTLSQYVDELAYQSQKLLGYDHVWVRLNAAKILSTILATTNFDLIHKRLMEEVEQPEDCRDFLYANPKLDIKSLILDHCANLFPGHIETDMAEEIMKNLFYIANMLKSVPFVKTEDPDSNRVNLYWLFHKIRFAVHGEVARAPHCVVIRKAVFNWIEGLSLLISKESLIKLTPYVLAPLVREMAEDDITVDPEIRQLAIQIGNRIRKKIGVDEYNSQRIKIQTKLNIKRAERKRVIAQEKINDPVSAAKRKQIEALKKKASKKRKVQVMKGNALPKKKRKKENADEFDWH